MEKKNKQAVMVLHEIYGINEFIEDTCQKFKNAGFDVFCPNMIGRPPFPYEELEKAYDHFVKHVGFDIYREISEAVNQLKKEYEKVFIVGFSIGATVAWRCCENSLCDGIVGCYGSRIRDYKNLNPVCPTLLLFAKNDSFDVLTMVSQLEKKANLIIKTFDATHGFMDPHSKYYNECQSKKTETFITHFISEFIK